MSVMANGWGSRDKARVALRRIQHVPKQDENTASGAVQSDEEAAEPLPLAGSSDTQQMQQSSGPKKPIVRCEAHLLSLKFLHFY